ncbi:hypothetical protein Tco_0175620, partial [Tanacetum coccineum]
MNRISSRRLSMITWVRWQCSQNISWVSKGKGLLGLNGGSGGKFEGEFWGKVRSSGGNGGREGSMFVIGGRGGSIARIGGGSCKLNDSIMSRRMEKQEFGGSKFYASGEECFGLLVLEAVEEKSRVVVLSL